MEENETEKFFRENLNHVNISIWEDKVDNFIDFHLKTKKKIVLVTVCIFITLISTKKRPN